MVERRVVTMKMTAFVGWSTVENSGQSVGENREMNWDLVKR